MGQLGDLSPQGSVAVGRMLFFVGKEKKALLTHFSGRHRRRIALHFHTEPWINTSTQITSSRRW